MAKRFTVRWTETYICKKVVEADSEEEAIEKAYDADPDKKQFDGYADWEAYPTDED